MYAEVAVYQAPVQRAFHYAVPPALAVEMGALVEVAFRTGLSQGIVLALTPDSPVPNPKPILDVPLPGAVVTPFQIGMARWMAGHYGAALGACLWLMLPPGVARRGGMYYTLQNEPADASPLARQVTDLLRTRGGLRAAQLDRALPKMRWREAIRSLVAAGHIACEPVLPAPTTKTHSVRIAWLAITPEAATAIIERLHQYPKQLAALRLLAEAGGEALTFERITAESGASADSIQRMARKGWVAVGTREQLADPLAGRIFPVNAAPALTAAQSACWKTIQAGMAGDGGVYLLHGVTGSGKTEIYLRAIEAALARAQQAIVLVPEIALVAPTVARYAGRFPGQVAVVHSGLTEREQYDTWRRAMAGEIDIVIGARSALFTPMPALGVVILDEAHDDSYKQSPPLPPPFYDVREMGLYGLRRAAGESSLTVILGSATPNVVTTFTARQGDGIGYLRLPDRVFGDAPDKPAELPPVQIVDMRAELREGNRSMFSRALHAALHETLARDEQAILFLNRRGHATFVLCRDCGYVARCPNCDIPLTYHQAGDERLVCHYCNYHAAPPARCPQCGGSRIRYLGAGTASLETAVQHEFPAARVARWDRDTAQNRQAHEQIFEAFASGAADVLVGTQMIVKGLDLPRVTLVGMMLADIALGLPDYRAGERAFQLLTQAAGRAGRGQRGGRAIIQTYQPDHYAIRAASAHDYEAFYDREIAYRQALGYPPYRRLVRFVFRSPSQGSASAAAEKAAEALRAQITKKHLTATTLIGPAPAFFGKIDGVYQWHILARTTDPVLLLDGLETRPGWIVDVDPVDIV